MPNVFERKKQNSSIQETQTKDLILFSSNTDSQADQNKKKRDINSIINEDSLQDKPYKKIKKNEKNEKNASPIKELQNSNNSQPIDERDFIAPWLTDSTIKIKNSLARMHNEIIDFYNYITPSEEEHNLRLQAIKEYQNFFQKNIYFLDLKKLLWKPNQKLKFCHLVPLKQNCICQMLTLI